VFGGNYAVAVVTPEEAGRSSVVGPDVDDVLVMVVLKAGERVWLVVADTGTPIHFTIE